MIGRLPSKFAGLGHRRERVVSHGHSPAAAAPGLGSYHTDGANLYRVVGHPGPSTDLPLIELEDCRSLEVMVLTNVDLNRARLHPVYAALDRDRDA